jgi:hypothetical protein
MSYTNTARTGCITDINMTVEDNDLTLGEMFAHFIDMCDKMGYQPGSWRPVLEDALVWMSNDDDFGIIEYSIHKTAEDY